MSTPEFPEYSIRQVAQDLVSCLSPDLLKRGYQGYCYIYAEALYHLAGKDLGYKPKCLRLPGQETHVVRRPSRV